MPSYSPNRARPDERGQLGLSWEGPAPTPVPVPPPSATSSPRVLRSNLEFWQWRREPFFWRCVDNLAVLVSAAKERVPPHAWRSAPLFRSARICSETADGRSSPFTWMLSLAAHCALVTVGVLWPTLADWNGPPHQATVKELLDQYTVLYYSKSDLLPAISPTTAPATRPTNKQGVEEATLTAAAAGSPRIQLSRAYAPQSIVSHRPNPDNSRQTIVQPAAPELRIPVDVSVPNLVALNREVPAPPPAPTDYGSRSLSGLRFAPLPTPAPPPPQRQAPASRSDPAAPQVQATPIRASNIQLNSTQSFQTPAFPVPVRLRRAPEPVAQVKAQTPAKQMPVAPRASIAGEFGSALVSVPGASVRMQDLPTIPVPVSIRRAVPGSVPREIQVRAMPDAPGISAAGAGPGDDGWSSLPSLVAVNITAPPPQEQIKIPLGNRAGEFAADAAGRGTTGGFSGAGPEGESGLGSTGPDSGASVSAISVPGLAVGGSAGAGRLPVIGKRSPAEARDTGQLLASLTRPTLRVEALPRGRPIEDEFFGSRRVYTAHVNMPNLTSRSGSWVLRFSERPGQEQNGDLSTPYVLRKVDPPYEAEAQREHVQGVILLAAQVQLDGSVTDVRVVRGLDARLDLSAISAFTQWKFQPAMREGKPVQMEVLVHIPFLTN